jgi:hypothetical protein
MKNWNDAGTVHFDASTDTYYTTHILRFWYRSARREMELKIPQTIRGVLKSEHFDQCITVAQRAIDDRARKLISSGDLRTDVINVQCDIAAKVAVLEHLYNAYTVEQAKLGNQVWATAKQMQDVGPPPEDDKKYFKGEA